jgi:predicted hotdog family 3-hydroxylacyl-ACP dehydratase
MLPISAYVPHRGAMLLLDQLLVADDHHAVCQVVVPCDGQFVQAGQVPAWIGLEYMAQTIAAWSGHRWALSRKPRMGLLLGSRRYAASCPAFAAGAVLQIEVQHQFAGENGMDLFDCTIRAGGVVVATGRVSTFEPPQPSHGPTHGPTA